jgi:hypothetical protein
VSNLLSHVWRLRGPPCCAHAHRARLTRCASRALSSPLRSDGNSAAAESGVEQQLAISKTTLRLHDVKIADSASPKHYFCEYNPAKCVGRCARVPG